MNDWLLVLSFCNGGCLFNAFIYTSSNLLHDSIFPCATAF